MSHSVIIIDEEIDRLIGETSVQGLQDKLGILRTKAEAVNDKLERTPNPIPPFILQAMHDLLNDLEKWLKKASASDSGFEAQLDEYIASLDYYDD